MSYNIETTDRFAGHKTPGIALYIVSCRVLLPVDTRRRLRPPWACGIALMHYTGMAAMEIAPAAHLRHLAGLIASISAIAVTAVGPGSGARLLLRSDAMANVMWKRVFTAPSPWASASVPCTTSAGHGRRAGFAAGTTCTAPGMQVEPAVAGLSPSPRRHSCFCKRATMLILTIDVRLRHQLDAADASRSRNSGARGSADGARQPAHVPRSPRGRGGRAITTSELAVILDLDKSRISTTRLRPRGRRGCSRGGRRTANKGRAPSRLWSPVSAATSHHPCGTKYREPS